MGVSKKEYEKQKLKRLGQEGINKQGYLIEIIVYNKYSDIVVRFLDEYKAEVHTSYGAFKNGEVENPFARLNEEKLNKQGCLMKIIKYINATDIIVEFQDKYKAKVHTQWGNFVRGNVKNPYFPSVCGVGIIGNKYPTWSIENSKHTKEYESWQNMLIRCYDNKVKEKYPTYQNVTCCEEWLLYENFYEWLHSQENFDKWLSGEHWDLDKDILVKGNKIYSPETCCLVPYNVNKLFVKHTSARGELPIGIHRDTKGCGFIARCMNPLSGKRDYLGYRINVLEAFELYKPYKENIIKQVAEIEYNKGNITKKCYDAMIQYEVEITD